MIDCQKCRSYTGCIGKEWYSYQDIRYCPHQVIWLILNLEILENGKWPPDPHASTDPNIKTGFSGEAYFVKPAVIRADLNYRIKRAGIFGKLLMAEIRANEIQLSPEAHLALLYIKGSRTKRMSFSAWCRKRRYGGKVTFS